MKKLILLLILVFETHCALTQSWEHYFSSAPKKYATSICQTYDNGYLMSVVMEGSPGIAFIYKLDGDGNILWTKTLSYPGTWGVSTSDICPTTDNGFLISGVSGRYDPAGAAFIMKFNECGERAWTRQYGIYNSYDYMYRVIPLADGNYLALGRLMGVDTVQGETVTLFKFNINGDSIWRGNFTHNYFSTGVNIKEIDSNIYISGQTYLPKPNSASVFRRSMLIKVDYDGNEVWNSAYDSVIYHHFISGINIIPTDSNKSLLLLNIFQDWNNTNRRWNYLIKTDTAGNIKWKKFISPKNDLSEWPVDIIKINDSAAIVICSVSYSFNFNTLEDYRLKAIKINMKGNVLDSVQFGTGDNLVLKAIKNKDNDIVVCGMRDYGLVQGPFVIKIKQNLQVDTMLNMALNYDSLCATAITTGTIIYDTAATSVGINELETMEKIKIYPNPVSDFLSVEVNSKTEKTLTLVLYNLLGVEQKQFSFSKSIQLNVKDLSAGIYIYKIMEGDKMIGVGKIVKD